MMTSSVTHPFHKMVSCALGPATPRAPHPWLLASGVRGGDACHLHLSICSALGPRSPHCTTPVRVQLLAIAAVLAAGLALWYILLLRPARNMGTRAATL